MQNELHNEEDEDDLSKYDETGIGSPTSGEEIREAQTTNRHKKVEEGLKNRRDKKLSSKLSMDAQLLNISKEDLSLKRKLVEQLEKSEEEFNSGMNKVFKSVFKKQLTLSTNSKHLISNKIGPLLAHQALIASQYHSMDTFPREMSKTKVRGTKKTREFMKRTTIVLISTSSDIYISFYFTSYLSC